MKDKNGETHEFKAYGIESLTEEVTQINLSKIKK